MGRLTDRKAWLWYLKPGLEKAERLKAMRDGGTGNEPVQEMTKEEALAYMRRLPIKGVPDEV